MKPILQNFTQLNVQIYEHKYFTLENDEQFYHIMTCLVMKNKVIDCRVK
jgi:hypothetical protein